MFKVAICSYISLVGVVIGGWLFLTLPISEDDKKIFQDLQEKGMVMSHSSRIPSNQQNRAQVRKDLWITQSDGNRLHDRIESQSSVLTLMPINGHIDIIEHLQQIRCVMQDRILEQNGSLFQQVRYFEATSGIYQYSISRFTAQVVSLSLFRLPGTDLPISFSNKTPYLKGIAQDVSFAVAGHTSQFQAKHFKATLNGQKEERP